MLKLSLQLFQLSLFGYSEKPFNLFNLFLQMFILCLNCLQVVLLSLIFALYVSRVCLCLYIPGFLFLCPFPGFLRACACVSGRVLYGFQFFECITLLQSYVTQFAISLIDLLCDLCVYLVQVLYIPLRHSAPGFYALSLLF